MITRLDLSISLISFLSYRTQTSASQFTSKMAQTKKPQTRRRAGVAYNGLSTKLNRRNVVDSNIEQNGNMQPAFMGSPRDISFRDYLREVTETSKSDCRIVAKTVKGKYLIMMPLPNDLEEQPEFAKMIAAFERRNSLRSHSRDQFSLID